MTRLNKLLLFLVTAMILVLVTGCNYQTSSTKNIGNLIESSLDSDKNQDGNSNNSYTNAMAYTLTHSVSVHKKFHLSNLEY